MEKYLSSLHMLRLTVMVFLPKREKQAGITAVAIFLNVLAVMGIVDLMAVTVSHVKNWTKRTGSRKKKTREPLQQQVP